LNATTQSPLNAFDADVLIYSSEPGHPVGELVRELLQNATVPVGVGSVLLIPEIISKPLRDGRIAEVEALSVILARLDLRPVDPICAAYASTLGAKYKLRAADAVHLATAVLADADRFITNNSKDFGRDITEIEVTYPADL
jgi:predicted nucleic acid-binding protein